MKNERSSESPASKGVLDSSPPPEVMRNNLELRRRLSVLLLTLLTMVLLGISFAPFDCWYVAYFALLPWAMAMAGGVRGWFTVLTGWFGGLVFWAGMVYWLAIPTVPGYLGAIVYLSLYWLVASVLVRRAMRRGWGMWIVLPVLWVSLEFLRARVPLLGFPWFFLAQSQYQQTTLIQIADVTGQYGVSFFVAMVNGVLLDLFHGPLFVPLRGKARLSLHMFCGVVVTGLVLAGMLLYGYYRLRQTPEVTAPGPKIGVVQEAFPLALEKPPTPAQTFLEAHAHRSMQLIGSGCDLVIWPETMLPAGMNKAVLQTDVRVLDDAVVRSLAMKQWPADAQQYSTPYLREALNRQIGPESWDRYRGAAVRFLLQRYLDESQFRKLSDAQARCLAFRLLGLPRTREKTTAALRAALLLHLPGPPATWTQLDPADVRAAARMILDAPLPKDADLPTAVREIRKVLAGREKLDRERLETQRGRSCLVETCSILLDCPILAGGSTFQRNSLPSPPGDEWVFENSVLWFDATGPSDVEYAKIILVPFSEYVPGKKDWPAMHRLLRKCVPELMPQIQPGRALTRFQLDRGKEHWQLATPICFEGTIARLCRRMVAAGEKDRLLLANLSNDGWFVRQPKQNPPQGTFEHTQHLVHSVFRAVENRVPVIRAVNTGISALVSSDGTIQSILELRIDEYRKRTMVSGVLEGKTLVDRRRSLYSLHGDLFAYCLVLPAMGLTAVLLRRRDVHRKEV
ncbi:MAG: hypothetical protein JXA11_00200 [Phycisphaerae bacterium]|nr:hypothetical protein [Phycisphaerae bacterium]